MTADLRRLLDDLDAAREKATPGEWSATDERADGGAYIDADPRPTGCPPPWVGHASRQPDAALIVAAVNNLPRLTAAVRAVLDLTDHAHAYTDGAPPTWATSIRNALNPAPPDASQP